MNFKSIFMKKVTRASVVSQNVCLLFICSFSLPLPPQYFNLNLSQFGPYRVDYSKTGRSVSHCLYHTSVCLGFALMLFIYVCITIHFGLVFLEYNRYFKSNNRKMTTADSHS